MPVFLMISRHSPERCPLNSEEAKKMILEVGKKLPTLTVKNGVKIVGNWTVMPEHMILMAFEAPSLEAFMKFLMEPEMMKWIANNTSEIKLAMNTEEALKMLK